jgi:hypothetical protein
VTIAAFVQEAVQYQLHFTSSMHTRTNPTQGSPTGLPCLCSILQNYATCA